MPASAGFTVYCRGPHQGGGTGNVVYRFRDALLELAYPIESAEIEALGEIGFAERWRWRENGHSPFGVIVQIDRERERDLPFDTWEYRPPFLPGVTWTIGRADPAEPLYMIAPFDHEHQPAASEPAIDSITITAPGLDEPSPVARYLDRAGICRVTDGQEAEMGLVMSRMLVPGFDMRPGLPLVLRSSSESA